jgi:hypothetical protein
LKQPTLTGGFQARSGNVLGLFYRHRNSDDGDLIPDLYSLPVLYFATCGLGEGNFHQNIPAATAKVVYVVQYTVHYNRALASAAAGLKLAIPVISLPVTRLLMSYVPSYE